MTYWQETTNRIVGVQQTPKNVPILIVGAGLAGTSVGHFLLLNQYKDFAIVDCGTENASYFRNAGHILHGICENYKASIAIHGRPKAKALFSLSEQFCKQVHKTVFVEQIDCDYRQGDYLFLPTDQREAQELQESVELLREDKFYHGSYMVTELQQYGFSKATIAKGCNLSAQANPVKFRNHLLQKQIDRGIVYYHNAVASIEEIGDHVEVTYRDGSKSVHESVVITTNAYSSQVSSFFADRKLVEPFRGQIIVSKPYPTPLKRMQFSMDHGYVYGTVTADNRFLIGGWRNNVPGNETGTYSLEINSIVVEGLKKVVEQEFNLPSIEWEYSWSGIMGSSKTGLPFVGPTTSRIFTCAGCTGYGFGWFHGCAKVLVDIMLGNPLPEGYQYLNPNQM